MKWLFGVIGLLVGAVASYGISMWLSPSSASSRAGMGMMWVGCFGPVAGVVGGLLGVMIGAMIDRCPRCRRRFTISKTGKTKKEDGWFKPTFYEWKCRHCGRTEWKEPGVLWHGDRLAFPRGHCATCGYNLTGNVSGVCPECGVEVKA